MGIIDYINGIQWLVVRDRVLIALIIVSFLFAVLEVFLYSMYNTGVFHLLFNTDVAYDGGPGFGSREPIDNTCVPGPGSQVCGGAGLNASTISLIVMLITTALYATCNILHPAPSTKYSNGPTI
jgi:hypothetical protein